MSENYSFFMSKDHDRVYNAKHWADYFLPFFKTGVFNGDLQVVAAGGMAVKINTGYAWIDGYAYHLKDSPLVIDLETASGNLNRMDSIVLRLDLTNRWIRAFCKTGSYNTGTPIPPEPEKTATIHEIVIAHVSVAAGVTEITQDMISDTRMDGEICGWVCGTVEEIDFSQIYAQFQAFMESKRSELIENVDRYKSWKENFTETQENTFNLMNTTYNTEMTDFKKNAVKEFNGWFNGNTENWKEAYLEWFNRLNEWAEEKKGTFNSWTQEETESFAAWLQSCINQWDSWFNGKTTGWQDEIERWRDNLTEKLTENEAINLQLQIGSLSDLRTQTKENLAAAVNELYGRNLNTIEEIRDNTDPAKTVGAMAFKEYLDGTGIPLAAPSGASVINKDEAAEIRWTDPEDIMNGIETAAAWEGTILIRKAGSPPANKADGTILLDSRNRNVYKTAGFTDNGLTNGETYYYGIFPYTTLRNYTYDCIKTITPAAIYPSAVSDVQVKEENAKVTITFQKDSTVTEVKCVYKTGSAPESAEDGTVISNFTSGASITGLINDVTYYFRLYAYNAKCRETVSGWYAALPHEEIKIVTWTDGTDLEIVKMLEAHYDDKINISDYWAIGDERVIHLDAMGTWESGTMLNKNGETHTAQDVTFVIIGFDHDNLATSVNGHTKAAVSVHMKDGLETPGIIDNDFYNYYYKEKKSYTRSWSECHRRKNWINSIFKNALPEMIQEAIKPVKKVTCITKSSCYSGTWSTTKARAKEITQDSCYLLSCYEIGLLTMNGKYNEEGETYEYYKVESNRIKHRPSDNQDSQWWLRSNDSESNFYWMACAIDAVALKTYPTYNVYIAVGFSL
ncbi:MAG: fibronectin type III domain-containing protein [Muribaculaceae bacterium]|nr:fibronectin type III domain-containing protein [Muribaculaceae bacterium]